MAHSNRYEARFRRLTAFAFNHTSEITVSNMSDPINLVNVHHQGARLRKATGINYEEFEIGSEITLNLNLDLHGTDNLTGRIGWASGDDIWVEFGSPLTVGVTDLQRKLDN